MAAPFRQLAIRTSQAIRTASLPTTFASPVLSRHFSHSRPRLATPSSSRLNLASTSQIRSNFETPSIAPLVPSDGSGLGVSRRERRRAQKERRKAALKRAAKNTISARLGVSTEEVSPYVRKDRQFKTFKPITRSLRWLRYPLAEHLWRGKPERSLTIAKRGKGGRNHHGHITVRSRGGGHRRRIRLVDFYRWEAGEQTVLRIEYDPGRSAHVALIEHNETKRRSYILATEGIREGDTVQSYRTGVPKSVAPGQGQSEQFEAADGVLEEQIPTESVPSMPAQTPTDGASPASLDPSAPQTTEPPSLMPGLELEADAAQSEAVVEEAPADSNAFNPSSLDLGIFRTQAIRPGNVLPLRLIPIGTTIHAISLLPTGPAKLVRSAGTFGQLVSFSSRAGAAPGRHAQIRLQSGEVRLVPVDCCACIGVVSNPDHQHRRIGKAGRSRWLGRRPHVRGVAMNATDHPHGGGRGKSKSNMHPRSIYGHLTKGPRTRKPSWKNGNKMVVKERPRRNGKRVGKP